jgi:hypothetical protein
MQVTGQPAQSAYGHCARQTQLKSGRPDADSLTHSSRGAPIFGRCPGGTHLPLA